MLGEMGNRALLLGLSFLVFSFGMSNISAQDETLADIQYREDYDRIQEIVKINQIVTRAIRLLELYEERRDMDPQLVAYVDGVFTRDLQSLMRQKDYNALKRICERVVRARPIFGQPYFFYGAALRQEKKMDEAMDAFAKCFVITNPLQKKARQLLDITYRGLNNASLIDQDKIIDRARKELREQSR